MNYQPIENYGIIGDLHTVALVGMDGSVDFMCFPRFDSPSIFLRILDHEKGGYFSLRQFSTMPIRNSFIFPIPMSCSFAFYPIKALPRSPTSCQWK